MGRSIADLIGEEKEIPCADLNQSGIFADTINSRYVDLFDSGKFLIEGDIGHNNGYELNVGITVKNKEDNDKVVEILKGSEE